MLLDYVIIKLSESKTTKGAFAYYKSQKGEGVSKMFMNDFGELGGGWPCDDIS